ncbi:murein biosynthesis integral membrane protein MurJ [Lysinibacillus sp. Ag94]|uniref:murein biosynthesis integral membrane protein MurJ n=1 Tax=Lysinibacillus sp. Ag94 TaxID=2936682 RepID=UPI00200CFBB8|nr:lipid II flippase MurJ [Lysinibacillus sp. Ag94]UPW83733.1 MATE family efflux transporter [Lysinibacillus sp. Ag94]
MNKFIKIVGAVAIINVVARVFGFLREMIIGYQYGSSHIADSIFTAYTIPNFLYLVVGGAFTTAVISIYNRETTDRALFVKQSFTIVLLTVSIMTILMLAFTNPIMEMFNQSKDKKAFSQSELDLAKNLYYWMMPSSILLVLSSWYSGLLNANQKFHLSSFAILIYNAIFLVIAVGLSKIPSIDAMGYGISALVSAAIMVYFLIVGYRKLDSHKVGFSFERNIASKQLWIMTLPIMLGGATIQIYALLQRVFAGMLSEGAVAAVNYSSRLMQFPQAILITAVTTVIFPILSQKEAENDLTSIKSLYSKGLHYLLLLLYPVTVYSYFYAENLVQVVYERGNFDAISTAITTPVLAIFCLSMYFLAANGYITRFYYAKGDSMAPVIFSLINVFVINIAVIKLLVDKYGAEAIAWGTLVSSVTNFIMLIIYAAYKYDLKMGIFSKELQFFRSVPPMIIITIVLYFSSKFLVFNNIWLTFIVGLVIFSAVVVGSYLLFGVKEVKEFSDKLKRKFLK